jgi:hypothetical protein
MLFRLQPSSNTQLVLLLLLLLLLLQQQHVDHKGGGDYCLASLVVPLSFSPAAST